MKVIKSRKGGEKKAAEKEDCRQIMRMWRRTIGYRVRETCIKTD